MVRYLRMFLVLAVMFGGSLIARTSEARLPPEALRVGRMGISGAIVGAAAGAVMWPLSGQVRTVFLGSSVGLYLGIAAGLYQEWDRSEREAETELMGVQDLHWEFQNQRSVQALGPTLPWMSWNFRF